MKEELKQKFEDLVKEHCKKGFHDFLTLKIIDGAYIYECKNCTFSSTKRPEYFLEIKVN